MPLKPMPPCRYRGCGNLQARDGEGFCEAHRGARDRETRRGRFRTPPRQRGYDTLYARNRALLLARKPLCEPCRAEGRVTLAEEVHHRIPLAHGGSNDVSNLVAVCIEHHQKLHASPEAEETGRAGRLPVSAAFESSTAAERRTEECSGE